MPVPGVVLLGIHIAHLATPFPIEATVGVGVAQRHLGRTAVVLLLTVVPLWAAATAMAASTTTALLARVVFEELDGLVCPGVLGNVVGEESRATAEASGEGNRLPFDLALFRDAVPIVITRH